MDQKDFSAVDVATLKAGMLVERPLYAYLSANGRYILLAKPLYPLEERVLDKFRRLGNAFSSEPPLETRFPQLADSSRAVRELCDGDELAPFEKNKAIRELTEWLVPFVLDNVAGPLAPLFFFHRAFRAPAPESLVHVADISLVAYERRLKAAACAGLLALWLGYSNTRFLAQLAQAVFCEASGFPGDVNRIPGSAPSDHRFGLLQTDRERLATSGDELPGVIELAAALVTARPGAGAPAWAAASRVGRKLARHCGIGIASVAEGRAA